MEERNDVFVATSQLTLRLIAGAMLLLGHGMAKVTGYAELAAVFPDPLGVGSGVSLMLAAGAETLAAVAVIIGLKTRWAATAILITMLVAAFGVHLGEGFKGMELALAYAAMYAAIAIGGAGVFSLDQVLANRKSEVGEWSRSTA